MKILSVDPASFKNLGIATFDTSLMICEAGVHTLDNIEQPWKACWPFFSFLDDLIQSFKPDLLICEKTSNFRGSFITAQCGNVIGAILASAGKNNLDIEFVFPTHVKKTVALKGKCTKTEMKKAVQAWLDLNKLTCELKSEHGTDALANIICFLKEKGPENGLNF